MGGAALLSGWPASLSAALAAMIMAAYFYWVWRLFMLFPATGMGVAFCSPCFISLIFVMAWVIIPVSLMGLLDTRFDFRKLNRRPDKPSDAEGDEE